MKQAIIGKADIIQAYETEPKESSDCYIPVHYPSNELENEAEGTVVKGKHIPDNLSFRRGGAQQLPRQQGRVDSGEDRDCQGLLKRLGNFRDDQSSVFFHPPPFPYPNPVPTLPHQGISILNSTSA